MRDARNILVTSALPYSNGDIHLGHLLEHILTDIWVRFQRMRGHRCIYVCADDTHGTATMLAAEQRGIPAEELIDQVRREHVRDFRGFHISHDSYYSTHSKENRQHAEAIYERLVAGGYIFTRTVAQLYDPERELFLADRYVKGVCPKCGSPDQYGDNCDNCGATYEATELGHPRSTLSGATPVLEHSEHYFFDLPRFSDMLERWISGGSVQPEVGNKLAEWFRAGLKPWDISRDAPYFGFLIPGTEDKYFYVWMDAPIGYMASFQRYVDSRNDVTFEEFWDKDSDAELHHFIGKDIVNFHALFWPAVLEASGHRKPTRIHAHGFITVDGARMSKSRGTFINASTYLDHLEPEYLRYYYATKIRPSIDDMDINLDDFVQRVNADLVGKVVNIASRCAGFIHRLNDGQLGAELDDPALFDAFAGAADPIAALYEADEFGKAVREITALADRANQYLAEREPWALAKEPGHEAEIQSICSLGLNLFKVLMVYLAPILPDMTTRACAFLNLEALAWDDARRPLGAHRINPFEPLLTRIDPKDVEAMVEATRRQADGDSAPQSPSADASFIDIDDFNRVDLRVARIVAADHVDGADRLLRLTLDLGGEQRQVFAGIKAAYDPASLVGRHTVMVANLKPREMKFGTSEGMVLAAGPGGKDVFLLSPDDGATPGMEVR